MKGGKRLTSILLISTDRVVKKKIICRKKSDNIPTRAIKQRERERGRERWRERRVREVKGGKRLTSILLISTDRVVKKKIIWRKKSDNIPTRAIKQRGRERERGRERWRERRVREVKGGKRLTSILLISTDRVVKKKIIWRKKSDNIPTRAIKQREGGERKREEERLTSILLISTDKVVKKKIICRKKSDNIPTRAIKQRERERERGGGRGRGRERKGEGERNLLPFF